MGGSNTSMWVYVQLVTSMTVTWSRDVQYNCLLRSHRWDIGPALKDCCQLVR